MAKLGVFFTAGRIRVRATRLGTRAPRTGRRRGYESLTFPRENRPVLPAAIGGAPTSGTARRREQSHPACTSSLPDLLATELRPEKLGTKKSIPLPQILLPLPRVKFRRDHVSPKMILSHHPSQPQGTTTELCSQNLAGPTWSDHRFLENFSARSRETQACCAHTITPSSPPLRDPLAKFGTRLCAPCATRECQPPPPPFFRLFPSPALRETSPPVPTLIRPLTASAADKKTSPAAPRS